MTTTKTTNTLIKGNKGAEIPVNIDRDIRKKLLLQLAQTQQTFITVI